MVDETSLLAELLCLEAENMLKYGENFSKQSSIVTFWVEISHFCLTGFWALPKSHLHRQKIAYLNNTGI